MKRWIALGAVIGLVVALAFTLAMPSRTVHSVYIPARHGHRVPVYGALQPYAPQRFSVATVQHSPRIARDALLGFIAGGLAAAALLSVGRTRRRPREV
jgi:hypothetical protein